MKKYTITVLLLIAAGLYLGYLSIKQSATIDESVYLKTSESVRFLKTLDNSINLLLFKLNYEKASAYTTLNQLNDSISTEFDELRFEALFEEIERSPDLDAKAEDFGDNLIAKQRSTEQFVEQQKNLRALDKKLNRLYREIQVLIDTDRDNQEADQDKTSTKTLVEDLLKTKINFYLFLETLSPERKDLLNDSLAKLASNIEDVEFEERAVISEYADTLATIITTKELVQKYFEEAVAASTTERLDAFEQSYANFHNGQINESKKFRTVLIIYGSVLLAILIIFAYLLRRQYLNLEQQVKDRTEKIAVAYNELKESQEQLIQSEKMASLGEMVAGIAHEINTPLGYVNGNVNTIQTNMATDFDELNTAIRMAYKEARKPDRDAKKLSQLFTTVLKVYQRIEIDGVMDENKALLKDSNHGLGEISGLVQSLKNFSRLDRQAVENANIHDCIESSIKIASHHIKQNNVEIEKDYGDIPEIGCTPSKLNQLFLNVITNACQAMKDNGGTLSITTKENKEFLDIIFTDQGYGMDEDTIQKMFDPFFTTKPIGEGTGLGMSISYKIVKEHKGYIGAESKPNEGTSILIQLPLNADNT